MKIRLEIALVGLAISFALPTLAQDAAIDPQIVQQLHAIGKKSDEAFLKGDAASLAALFTEDQNVYGRYEQGGVFSSKPGRSMFDIAFIVLGTGVFDIRREIGGGSWAGERARRRR